MKTPSLLLFRQIFGIFLVASLLTSCETDDVEGPAPAGVLVSLSADRTIISEDGGTAVITASLSETSTETITVTLLFAGTATQGADYSSTSGTIAIAPGSTSGTITITALQDTLEEGNETAGISISAVSGGNSDGAQSVDVIIEDDDVAQVAPLLINEVLYDPSNSGLDGDANGDGVYAQNEDEFIEFVNLSSQSLDMSGYTIFDAENLAINSPNHTFPANTIVPSGGAIVVFGGGTPTGDFGGAIVQTSTSGDLNMNNAGDFMTVMDTNGNVVVTFDVTPLSDNPNESYTRNPDITGDFVQHGSISDVLFSPGTKVDGTPF